MSGKTNPNLTSMRKHLVTYNKMVRAETYNKVAKMKADQVRAVFSRDFREVKSGKDGKTYFAPKNYDISIDSGDKFIAILKDLSKDLRQNKPQTKSEDPKPKKAEPKKAEPKKAEPKKAKEPAQKKEEPKKSLTLKRLVSIAQSHKKNGISQEGLKDFINLVKEYQKQKPPKMESQLAGVLYNYLLNNIFLKKKRMPKNLNRTLTELNLRTF